MRRGLSAEIDLDAAKHNLYAVRKTAKGLPVIAVVKADAYGHGAVRLARAFEDAGAAALAVAFASEARELRDAGVKAPVIVLFDRTGVEECFDLGLTPVLHDLKTAEAFSREAARRKRTLDVHVKVDTGMGRMGLGDLEEARAIAGLEGLRVTGLMSHFSEADLSDMDYARAQLAAFLSVRDELRKRGLSPICHMANSAATLCFAESHLDAVRPGLALYGYAPSPGLDAPLRPVMKVSARVVALRRLGKGRPVSYERTFITRRPTLAAVLGVGYADGYGRLFSNNASVLIRGRRAPVLGRVCMDLTVVDATDIEGVTESDEAVLLGPQGGESVGAWELARNALSIPYEILLSLGKNASRAYLPAGSGQ
ncbi:MAG: alanine racemase [Thermodesulfovibrionales bacterium]